MSEKLVRLWDKDWNLIGSGTSVDEVVTSMNVTVDQGSDRKSFRVASAELRPNDLEFLTRLQWPLNPYLPEVAGGYVKGYGEGYSHSSDGVDVTEGVRKHFEGRSGD